MVGTCGISAAFVEDAFQGLSHIKRDSFINGRVSLCVGQTTYEMHPCVWVVEPLRRMECFSGVMNPGVAV